MTVGARWGWSFDGSVSRTRAAAAVYGASRGGGGSGGAVPVHSMTGTVPLPRIKKPVVGVGTRARAETQVDGGAVANTEYIVAKLYRLAHYTLRNKNNLFLIF